VADVKHTPLHGLHARLGARMVPFAGWDMPVHYAPGVLKEHLHARAQAGLFDVSHMGQVILRPRSGRVADAAAALERLVPADILGLKEGRQRYAVFTDPQGGILDDLMVANRGDHLFLVVNAARADHDLAHLRAHLSDACTVETPDRALIALQGPGAEAALHPIAPGAALMRFMDVGIFHAGDTELWISRSGYTGDDGFEISVAADQALSLAGALLARPGVQPIGLGARDSLRLEAGLPLYGQDLDPSLSPVEAGLGWSVGTARRDPDRATFPGAARILRDLAEGPPRRLTGLLPDGRGPMRPPCTLYAPGTDMPVGHVTSGGFGPSLDRPISMALIDTAHAAPGTLLDAEVRGRRLSAVTTPLPFRAATYRRGTR
jgi:aminomethyltransferase